MLKFQFGLQTVLKVRQQKEKRIQQEVLDQKRHLFEQMRRLEDLENERTTLEKESRRRGGTVLNLEMERACCDYQELLKKRLLATHEKIRALESELARQRDIWIQARKDVKILERLRDRRYGEYQKRQHRVEQKRVDDLSLMRHRLSAPE